MAEIPRPKQFNSRVQRFPERISIQSLDSQETTRGQSEIGLQVANLSCIWCVSWFSSPLTVAAEPLQVISGKV